MKFGKRSQGVRRVRPGPKQRQAACGKPQKTRAGLARLHRMDLTDALVPRVQKRPASGPAPDRLRQVTCAHARVCEARAGLSGLLTLLHSPPSPSGFFSSHSIKYLPKGFPGVRVAGTSPSNAGGMGSVLGQQLKSHMPQETKTEQKWYYVTVQ